MRFFAYTTLLVVLFSVLITSALKAQSTPPCDITDSLITLGPPALFDDPCCGQPAIIYSVCYDIAAYFESIETDWEECEDFRLFRFTHPGPSRPYGAPPGGDPMGTAALLAAVAPPSADKTAVIVVPILSPRSTGMAPTNEIVCCA